MYPPPCTSNFISIFSVFRWIVDETIKFRLDLNEDMRRISFKKKRKKSLIKRGDDSSAFDVILNAAEIISISAKPSSRFRFPRRFVSS